MAFEFLINSILNEHKKRYSKGNKPVPGDTICLLCSENGTIYTGFNTISPAGDNLHAEIAAVNSMRKDKQTMIRAITVFDCYTGVTIIPCTGCLRMLLSVDYRNISTVIATPSGLIPVTQYMTTFNNMSQGYSAMPYASGPYMSRNMSGNMNQVVSRSTPTYSSRTVSDHMSRYMNQRPGASQYINHSINHQNNQQSDFFRNKLNDFLSDNDD